MLQSLRRICRRDAFVALAEGEGKKRSDDLFIVNDENAPVVCFWKLMWQGCLGLSIRLAGLSKLAYSANATPTMAGHFAAHGRKKRRATPPLVRMADTWPQYW